MPNRNIRPKQEAIADIEGDLLTTDKLLKRFKSSNAKLALRKLKVVLREAQSSYR